LEVCCDPLGLNGSRTSPFYSEQNSLLDHEVSGQSIFCNPLRSLAIKYVEQLRACHSKSQLDTKAVIVLQDWPKFKEVTKELKFIKQLSKGETVFIRTTPTCTYEPPDNITYDWVINYWLIDANTLVFSHIDNSTIDNSTIKHNIVTIFTTQLEANAAIEATNIYLSA